jgi:hypothetical protein
VKRVGLRRRLPRLSYVIRWVVVQFELSQRAYRHLSPEERWKVDQFVQSNGYLMP